MDKIRIFLNKYRYYAVLCLILTAGIFYRFEVYLIPKLFTFDEAQLIYNFTNNDGILWTFFPLQNFQVAPPVFLILTKILALLFGFNEKVFTFIPFISGIISVFIFYLLSEKILVKKRAIIFANFLFAINYSLITYGNTFKQYTLDTLIFMLALIFVSKLEVKGLKNLDVLKYGIIFTLLFLTSQPVIFILFGFIVYHFIKTLKEVIMLFLNASLDKTLKNFVKFVFKALKYFKFCLIPILPFALAILTKLSLPGDFSSYMDEYWQYGFLSIKNLPALLSENLKFFVYQSKYLYPLLPFAAAGFIIFILRKKRINQIFLLSMFGAVLASILHLYPLLIRLIIYLIPFLIIFISIAFDVEIPNKKADKAVSCILIFGAIISTILFSSHNIFKTNMKIFLASNEARAVNSILFENFKRGDTLIMPSFSKPFYHYYSNQNNFSSDKILFINSYHIEKFKTDFNQIKDNTTYWIYLISDVSGISQEKLIDEKLMHLAKCKNVYALKTKLGGQASLYLLRTSPF